MVSPVNQAPYNLTNLIHCSEQELYEELVHGNPKIFLHPKIEGRKSAFFPWSAIGKDKFQVIETDSEH